ncbi:MAG: HAMP domain-containing sensor histidine kinase [Clostridia bacterium]|nr:HAMP domain-containing sensor histidine kinase [Clostridia bacterium]
MKRFIACLVALFAVLTVISICVGMSFEYERIDNSYINEVIQGFDSNSQPEIKVYDYTFFDREGRVLFSTVDVEDMSYDARINRAIGDGDIVVDCGDNKAVFYIKSQEAFEDMRNTSVTLIVCLLAAAAFTVAVCAYLIYRRTLLPFKKLKNFAQEIAAGNLDSPLLLDKHNSFGAFGEAFDIMRNNLKESRLAEQRSVVDKRRLMQEIGHELKTPLASIKAIAEYGQAFGEGGNYAVIADKANAIDNLVNDFYHATLEEEGQLNIYMTRHTCKDLADVIKTCDYNNRASIAAIPDCALLYDKIRMTQIIDNIIANSYKYADTDIDVEFSFKDGKLTTRIKDSGAGIPSEQLSYVMDRFYRGKKTEEKMGQGLGLHICRKLAMRMGGEMKCYNDGGFAIELVMPASERNS